MQLHEYVYKYKTHIFPYILYHLYFDNIYNLTCSIGLTEISPADTEKSAFDRADKAMYDAKTNGRNCVVAK